MSRKTLQFHYEHKHKAQVTLTTHLFTEQSFCPLCLTQKVSYVQQLNSMCNAPWGSYHNCANVKLKQPKLLHHLVR